MQNGLTSEDKKRLKEVIEADGSEKAGIKRDLNNMSQINEGINLTNRQQNSTMDKRDTDRLRNGPKSSALVHS